MLINGYVYSNVYIPSTSKISHVCLTFSYLCFSGGTHQNIEMGVLCNQCLERITLSLLLFCLECMSLPYDCGESLPCCLDAVSSPGKGESREAALSPEDDEQSRGQVTNLQP